MDGLFVFASVWLDTGAVRLPLSLLLSTPPFPGEEQGLAWLWAKSGPTPAEQDLQYV